jgi:photosystem II stability/assembly factor-like uncharacterized protein
VDRISSANWRRFRGEKENSKARVHAFRKVCAGFLFLYLKILSLDARKETNMRHTKSISVFLLSIGLCGSLNTVLAQQYGWTKIAQPTTSFISAIDFVDSLHGCIGVINANADQAIFKTSDGGNTWQRQTAPLALNVQSISFANPLEGWIVGDLGHAEGYIIHTTSGGQAWQGQLRVLRHFYNGVNAHNPWEATVTGNVDSFFVRAGLIARTRDSGNQWQERRFLTFIGKVDFVDSLHGWAFAAIGDSIRLIHTADGGNIWEILPYDISKEIFGLTGFDFVDSLRGWAVGRFEYPWVIRTIDGGKSWEKISKFPSDNTSSGGGNIAFADTLNGWIFGDGFIDGGLAGVIYRTTDGGLSWFRELVDHQRAWTNGVALDLEHLWAATTIGEVWRYGLITAIDEPRQPFPPSYFLAQNYPNPFNPITKIDYRLPKQTEMLLTVHDILGKEVKVLVKAIQGPGRYQVEFDANGLASGTYFYRLKTEDFEETKQMQLVK